MQQLDKDRFTMPNGSIISIAEDGVWFEPRIHLTFEEFSQLAERVREYQRYREPIDEWFLASILNELRQLFGGNVQIIEVKRELHTDHDGIRYITTMLDHRTGLVHTCRTIGEYLAILRQLHTVKNH